MVARASRTDGIIVDVFAVIFANVKTDLMSDFTLAKFTTKTSTIMS